MCDKNAWLFVPFCLPTLSKDRRRKKIIVGQKNWASLVEDVIKILGLKYYICYQKFGLKRESYSKALEINWCMTKMSDFLAHLAYLLCPRKKKKKNHCRAEKLSLVSWRDQNSWPQIFRPTEAQFFLEEYFYSSVLVL